MIPDDSSVQDHLDAMYNLLEESNTALATIADAVVLMSEQQNTANKLMREQVNLLNALLGGMRLSARTEYMQKINVQTNCEHETTAIRWNGKAFCTRCDLELP